MKYMLLFLSCVAFLPGCAIQAQKYEISAENIQQLKRSGDTKLRIGAVTADSAVKDKINSITFRGSPFVSPYGGAYETYLKEAITEDLKQATRFSEKSDIEISGIMLKNEFDASGVNIGLADISARIIVKNNGNVKYDKVISHHQEWESYFAAFSAAPAAQIGYVDAVRNFLLKVYTDKDFINACK